MASAGRVSWRGLAALGAAGLLALTAGCGDVLHQGHAALLGAQFDALEQDPSYGSLFAEMHKDFPTDYAAMREKVMTGLADVYDEAQIKVRARAISTAFMADFKRTHLPYAAKASDAMLAEVAGDQLKMMQGLQAIDPALCGNIAMGRTSATDGMTSDAQKIVANSAALMMRAVRDGMDHPVEREAMGRAEGTELVAIMRRQQVDEGELRLIFGGGLMTAPPAEQCTGSLKLFEAVQQMPLPMRARFMGTALIGAAKINN